MTRTVWIWLAVGAAAIGAFFLWRKSASASTQSPFDAGLEGGPSPGSAGFTGGVSGGATPSGGGMADAGKKSMKGLGTKKNRNGTPTSPTASVPTKKGTQAEQTFVTDLRKTTTSPFVEKRFTNRASNKVDNYAIISRATQVYEAPPGGPGSGATVNSDSGSASVLGKKSMRGYGS